MSVFPLRPRLSAVVATAFLFAGLPTGFGGSPHPAEVTGLKSGDSNMPAQITFANRSARTIKVYWLDWTGKRVLYKTLKGGKEYLQLTFLHHPWLITDEDDNAWYLFYADGQPRRIDVIDPALQP